MNRDYTLTEKDARLDKLTAAERTQLTENMNRRNNDYLETHVKGRSTRFAKRETDILNDIARQAGFDGYFRNGSGNSYNDWLGRAHDGNVSARIEQCRRLLSESPEYTQLKKEEKQLETEKCRFLKDSKQKLYHAALLIAIPRIIASGETWQQPSERKPVILTADDVRSVLLQDEETRAIEFPRRIEADRLNKKVFTPLFSQIHQVLDKEMDKLAQQAGFEQFDENQQGTGLRNYTAQGKPMTPVVKAQVDEYTRLYKTSPVIKTAHRELSGLLKVQESMVRALNQIMFRNMLDITNERMTRVDAGGQTILTPQKYLEMIEGMDAEEKRLFEEPFTTWIETNGSDMGKIFPVDKGIADFVKQINDIGYRTGQSCSGLLVDHPNYRYVQDSDVGLYVKGECINYNKQGSGTYLTFYKTYNNFKVNKPEQIDDIRRIAAEQGWIVEDMEIFAQPSVRLGLPYTYDGLGKREILHIANEITDALHPGLKKDNFLEWLEYRNKEEKKVVQNHGGAVRWTDDMVKQRWQKLTQSLVQAQRERLGLDRISDVHIYLGGDGHRRIKCRIDGVDMLSEHFSDAAMTMLNKGADIKILAARCYEDQLRPQQDKGLKR